MFKNRWRCLYWILLGALAFDFLVPHRILAAAKLDSRTAQMSLCAALVVYELFVAMSANAVQGAARFRKEICRAVVGIAAYLGALEAAQLLTPDRHARWFDFLCNSAAAMGVGVVFLLLLSALYLAIIALMLLSGDSPDRPLIDQNRF
jgi:hypothetical protein